MVIETCRLFNQDGERVATTRTLYRAIERARKTLVAQPDLYMLFIQTPRGLFLLRYPEAVYATAIEDSVAVYTWYVLTGPTADGAYVLGVDSTCSRSMFDEHGSYETSADVPPTGRNPLTGSYVGDTLVSTRGIC